MSSTEDSRVKRTFGDLWLRLHELRDRYFAGSARRNAVLRTAGDEDLLPELLGLARAGLQALVQHREFFVKHGLAADGGTWCELLETIRQAAGLVAAEGAEAYVPRALTRELVGVLLAVFPYFTFTGCDSTSGRIGEALLAVLVTFPDAKAEKTVRRESTQGQTYMHKLLLHLLARLNGLRAEGRKELATDPGKTTSDAVVPADAAVRDDRNAAFQLFKNAGCPVPPIPEELLQGLFDDGQGCVTTRNFRLGPEIFGAWLDEAHSGVVADFALVTRCPVRVFGAETDCLEFFLVLGPLMLFVIVPIRRLKGSPDGLDGWDEIERTRVMAGIATVIKEARKAIRARRIRELQDDCFVIVVGKQVAWCQGGVPAPDRFDDIAGHFDDKFPLICEWFRDPKGAEVGPYQVREQSAGGRSDDETIPSFEPRGRISKPPRIVWGEINGWTEATFEDGVNVHLRAADHDLGRLVARIQGFGWREKPGSTTRVFVLPVSNGKGPSRRRIYPTMEEAEAIRQVVKGWSKDGARCADLEGYVFDERG